MKKLLNTSIIVAALTMSSHVFAEETVRLIVTKKDGTSAVMNGQGTVSTQAMERSVRTVSSDLRVPESDVVSTIAALKKDPDVIAVERDVIVYPTRQKTTVSPYSLSVYQQTAGGAEAPNDPDFEYQSYFMARGENFLTGSDILGAWGVGPQKVRPKIAVMDGGFLQEGRFADVDPVANYSFVNSGGSKYGDSAYNDEEEMGESCAEDGHGIGIYGLIGAISNNNEHIAGIVEADMYMLQVMRCGSGRMYDAAQALRWSAGDVIEGLPTLDEPVDIATFSLGSISGCPVFMQSAIDFATSRGVKVFMAAGNNNVEVSRFSPANCQGNMVTSGLDRDTGDKANFSNYGEGIDIMTQGTDVGSLANFDGGIGLWSGTSFAGPIAAGIYGLAKAHAPSLSNETLDKLMKMTVDKIDAPICNENGCGEGLVNAQRFVSLAAKFEDGSFAEVKSALADTAICDMTPYLMATGVKSRLCNAYTISIDADIFSTNDGDEVNYRLYQWASSESFDYNESTLIYAGPETEYMVTDLDQSMETGIVRCVNGACDVSLVMPVSLEDTERPRGCDE